MDTKFTLPDDGGVPSDTIRVDESHEHQTGTKARRGPR